MNLSSDPWEWPELSKEEFKALAELHPLHSEWPPSKTQQYIAVRRCLVELKPEIEAGSGFAVLAAVQLCGTNGLPMPLWLVYAFNRRYHSVLQARADSWDSSESFGKPYPKGMHLNARRKERVLRFRVWIDVYDILNKEPDTPVDVALFERVGGPIGLGASLASKYYYLAKESWGPGREAKETASVRRLTTNRERRNFTKKGNLPRLQKVA